MVRKRNKQTHAGELTKTYTPKQAQELVSDVLSLYESEQAEQIIRDVHGLAYEQAASMIRSTVAQHQLLYTLLASNLSNKKRLEIFTKHQMIMTRVVQNAFAAGVEAGLCVPTYDDIEQHYLEDNND